MCLIRTNMEKLFVCGVVLIAYANFGSCAIGSEDHSRNSIGRTLDVKNMLSSLAGNLMSRGFATFPGVTAAGGSQVISLNLTNLVVLVLLKALIFAAGSLGAGTWKGGYGRSDGGEDKLFTDEEILLFLSYLTGSPGNNGCLQNIACQQPLQAKRYAAAGDMLLKTSKLLSIQPDLRYDYVLQELEEASEWGKAHGNCDRFVCGLDQKLD